MCRSVVACLLASLLAYTQLSTAGEHCAHCGCCSHLRKVCRVVPETKEVVEVCWDVKCEDFCVPGPSKLCGVCRECDDCGSWRRFIWKPGCAEVRTRKVPVKREVKRQVQTFRWEVVTVCDACCRRCADSLRELTPDQRLAASVTEAVTGHEATEVPPPLGPVVRPVSVPLLKSSR